MIQAPVHTFDFDTIRPYELHDFFCEWFAANIWVSFFVVVAGEAVEADQELPLAFPPCSEGCTLRNLSFPAQTSKRAGLVRDQGTNRGGHEAIIATNVQ